MSNIMSSFDWKGYAKDVQKDNNLLRKQIESMAYYLFTSLLVCVGLTILVITLWRA